MLTQFTPFLKDIICPVCSGSARAEAHMIPIEYIRKGNMEEGI